MAGFPSYLLRPRPVTWFRVVAATLLLGVAPPRAGATEGRVALVLGTEAERTAAPTPAENDAVDVAQALRDVGFTVIQKNNASKRQIEDELIPEFARSLQPGGVAVFYYAGHGAQINGVNYLRPGGATVNDVPDVKSAWVNLDVVMTALGSVDLQTRFVFLDACRDNPLLAELAATTQASDVWIKGLAEPVSAPRETVVSFATSPGDIALDYDTLHSKYTQALLKYLREPGLRADDLFKRVGLLVEGATNSGQVPWVNTSTRIDFYFRAPVFVVAQLGSVDDELLMVLDGEEVFASGERGAQPTRIPLRVGLNHLSIKIYNQHSFTGGPDLQDVFPWMPPGPGHLPEGWHYSIQFRTLDGRSIAEFSAREDQPPKDGARHGHTFTVATADIVVDDTTGAVTFLHIDRTVWTRAK